MNAAASFSPRVDTLRAAFLSHPHQLLIGGRWVPAASGETLTVLDPASGAALAQVAAGGAADIDQAVQAARRAFESGPWPSMSHAERGRLMLRLADLIERHADEIALIESLDGGNPVASTRHVDVAMAIESVRYNAGWTTKLTGETALSSTHSRAFSYTLREPVGVVGAITPWNAPFLMAVNKLAPALATGCTVVLKPAELAPLSALRLGELLQELELPPGVVNIVTGYGASAGQALVDHPDVTKISFTGSTRVGTSILAGAAVNMKRVTLELGGNSPVIVLPDADLEAATAVTTQTIFFKTGQFCAAGTRLFAHRKIFDRMVEGFAERAQQLRVGPGTAPDTEMGPIISEKQLDRVLGYIEAGTGQGAELITGGHRLTREGYFVEPTLLANVRPDMSVFRDEIFGPVLCALAFDDEDELEQLVRLANDTSYGLAANLWTGNLSIAHRLARRIQAGTITVNGGGREQPMPFGGYKQSGLGREGGREGIEAYTELKTVAIGL